MSTWRTSEWWAIPTRFSSGVNDQRVGTLPGSGTHTSRCTLGGCRVGAKANPQPPVEALAETALCAYCKRGWERLAELCARTCTRMYCGRVTITLPHTTAPAGMVTVEPEVPAKLSSSSAPEAAARKSSRGVTRAKPHAASEHGVWHKSERDSWRREG